MGRMKMIEKVYNEIFSEKLGKFVIGKFVTFVPPFVKTIPIVSIIHNNNVMIKARN